jgi:eukaryotic-like serine/threonine-protein kinase
MALEHSAASLGTLGNYDLLEKVGEGSMGTVYKASHWVTKEIVAVKVMPSHVARKPLLLKRFEQEFRIANRLSHPNVVRVLEYSGQGQEPYLVMEFVDGVSLGERLEREGRMAEEDAVRLIVQVGEGLHHAHGVGLLHRDVKPDNVLVTGDGTAKLTDLGLGKELDAVAELTRTGSGLGTPNFMAPEQFRNAKNADARCDVYSLAATLYQMVTGELPFGQGDPVRIMMRKLNGELTPIRELAPHVSERTEQAILRAMDAEPERRTATCRDFIDDLLGRAPETGGPVRKLTQSSIDTATDVSAPPTEDAETVRRAQIEARLGEWTSGRAGWRSNGSALPARAAGQPRPTAAEARPPQAAPPAVPPGAPVPSWHIPLSPPAPVPQQQAPPAAPAGSPLAVPLVSARFLARASAEPAPLARPSAASEPPGAPRSGWLAENWKTALVIAATGVASAILSRLLFLLK